MSTFKDGDLVVVRSDLTAEEKQKWPHFVIRMEPCVGHIYKVDNRYDFALTLCNEDPSAPDPREWAWNALWCRPAVFMEETEEADMSMIFELV